MTVSGTIETIIATEDHAMTAPTKIFVVAGQSNASRIQRAQSLEEVIQENGLNAQVVHSSMGGTSLGPRDNALDWYPFADGNSGTGELTRTLLNDIDTKLAEDPSYQLAGVLWVQGEADASFPNGYLNNLTELHRVLVGRYRTNFDFTVSQLSENMQWFTGSSGQRAIQKAQADFVARTPNTTLLDPDDAISQLGHSPQNANADIIHFSNEGADAIGYSFLTQFYNGLSITYDRTTANGAVVTQTYVDGGTPAPAPGPTNNSGTAPPTTPPTTPSSTNPTPATVTTSTRAFGSENTNGGSGRDHIINLGGDDTISANGGNDQIAVLSGRNTINGQNGNDLLIGGIGDDTLSGGSGLDVIVGERGTRLFGSDQIEGGAGNDFLMGGSGADVFVFSQNEGRDTIGELAIDFANPINSRVVGADFEAGLDRIDVSAFGYTNASQALAQISDKNGSAVFSDAGTTIVLFAVRTADLSENDFII